MPEINKNPSGGSRGPGGGGGGGRGPGRGPRRMRPNPAEGGDPSGWLAVAPLELTEKVVFTVNRSAKVVKGGRRFSFSALVVAGDKHGRVGVGLGKAVEVSEAIRKGGDVAKTHMVNISLKESTIPHEILCRHGGAKVILRPASPGTGLIAGKTVRAVLESVGIKDVLSKSLGSNNPSNVVKATIAGLLQLRLREDIYRGRGLEFKPRVAAIIVPAKPGPATVAKPVAVAVAAPAPVAVVQPVPAPVTPENPPAPPAATA